MPESKVDYILRRHSELLPEHEQNRSLWQDIADVMHPVRAQFTSRRSPGTKKTTKLFDSTALQAKDRLAAAMAGNLVSRAAQWFDNKFRDERFNNDRAAKVWAEDCATRMYRAFNQSNFASEVHETLLDCPTLGTSILFEDERPPSRGAFAGLVFRAHHLNAALIDEDAEGRVDTVIRWFEMTVHAAAQKWGLDALGEKAQKAYRDGKMGHVVNLMHACYPRATDARYAKKDRNAIGRKMPWASCYVDLDDKVLVNEGGYQEFPFMVPRWQKGPGERYGTGLGHIALPDVKTLNKAVEIGLKGWAKSLNPPTKSLDDGVVGSIDNRDGGNTVVRDMDGLQPLYPADYFRAAAQVNQINAGELRQAIRQAFFADQIALPDKSYMTAFEVARQFELMARLLGPTLGRLEQELLNPLIERTFGIMLRRGAFLPAPTILGDGADIDIEYEGPLAKAQRLSEVEGLERLLGFGAALSELRPEVMDNLDVDVAFRLAADVMGVPAEVVRDPDDVEAEREARAAAQQQEAAAAGMREDAAAGGKVAPLVTALQNMQTARRAA